MKKQSYLALFFIPTLLIAEEASTRDLKVSLSTIRTEAEKAAVGFAIDWSKKISVEKLIVGDGWLTQVSPDVKIQTGDQDAFNGIVAKAVGYHAEFDTTRSEGGTEVVDSKKPFHVFPFSIGAETNRDFSAVNSLVEAGYIPFRRLSDKHILGLNPAIAVFLQGGYKFDTSSTATGTGGATDESEEKKDSAILRAKFGGELDYAIIDYRIERSFGLAVIGEAWGWYDIVNNDWYHRLAATLRLTVGKEKHFDLKYENGSGAPNFNEGDQFSASLTVAF